MMEHGNGNSRVTDQIKVDRVRQPDVFASFCNTQTRNGRLFLGDPKHKKGGTNAKTNDTPKCVQHMWCPVGVLPNKRLKKRATPTLCKAFSMCPSPIPDPFACGLSHPAVPRTQLRDSFLPRKPDLGHPECFVRPCDLGHKTPQ